MSSHLREIKGSIISEVPPFLYFLPFLFDLLQHFRYPRPEQEIRYSVGIRGWSVALPSSSIFGRENGGRNNVRLGAVFGVQRQGDLVLDEFVDQGRRGRPGSRRSAPGRDIGASRRW